ncbi:MAG: copper-translocating P-type ATPase [Calditrichaeota bacterium]|nr:copper-translocating P-type ATPase [Calditrichota bacterium]
MKKDSSHDHEGHEHHDHEDHEEHKHADHEGHDHHKHEMTESSSHGHEGHEHHDHADHEEHQHADHEGHDHHKHEMTESSSHDHEGHEHHDHGDHGGHEHGEHEGHNHHDHHAHMVADFRKRFWIALVITVPVLIMSPMIQKFLGLGEALRFPGDLFISFILSSIVYFYGGWPFLKGLWTELRKKTPGMMTLIALAVTVAYVYSTSVVLGLEGKVFFWELATLIDIMLLGHWIEMKSVMGASRALEELARLMPSEAHKIMPNGDVVDVAIDQLKPGDKVLIKPGEKIPADGKVFEGETSVNESMLTGESKPVYKRAGDPIIGGSINGEGSVTVTVGKTGKDSFLSQVITLVQEAQQSKSKTQDLANKAAFWLTIIAISAGAITFFVWVVIIQKDVAFALERTVTVMVITCPHALGLAVPLVVAVSTALSATNGLLIRNRTAFEIARNLQAIIFDKTGTLTKGEFGVTDTIVFNNSFKLEEMIELAAAVESHSEHPIAKGITNAAKNHYDVQNFKSIPGKGALGLVNGKQVSVVSPGYLREKDLQVESDRVEQYLDQGKTVVFVLVDNQLIGAIALADVIRPESRQAIRALKQMGIKTMMLTGDNKKVAQWVAEELELDEYFAEVLPHEKALKVKEVQERGLIVAMTGDGVNDAPALATADVGIAIGAGTDVAVETADIILVNSNPMDAVAIITLAKATYRKMVQNLAWATGYNAFAIPLAAGVLYTAGIILSPAMGAVLMSLSTVIVAFNARLLKVKKN